AGAGLTIAIISYRSPWIWYGSRDAYQRHRMLTFEMPPKQVVYEEDPVRAARLAGLPFAPRAAYVGDPQHPGRTDLMGDGDYRRWAGNTYAEYVPPFFVSLFRVHCPTCLVFIHERAGASRHRRMVLVTLERDLANHHPPVKRSVAEANVRVGLYVG